MKIKNIEKYTVKEKIFAFYMLSFLLFSLIEIAVNVGSGLAFYFNIKWIIIFLSAAGLLYLGIHLEKKNIIRRICVYLSAFVITPVAWMDSPGLLSPGIIYSFPILIMINYLLTGKERIIVNFFYLIVNLVILYLACNHPEYFSIITKEEQTFDWMTSFPTAFILASILLASFERAYEKERKKSENTSRILKEKSQTDTLTGLYNRDHLAENWPKMLSLHRRQDENISLIMFDIDFFKNYNDYYGHNKGDICLITFSRILEEHMERDTDFAYRIGGEEFLVLLGQTDQNGAMVVAAKIMETLAAAAIPHERSAAGKYLTATAGITSMNTTDCSKDFQLLLDEADKALYQGKEEGRNRIISFSEELIQEL